MALPSPSDSTSGRISSPLALGIDMSTQSLTGVLIDPQTAKVVDRRALSYVEDPRLRGCGIDHQSFLVPPRREGEADQPPALFLASLDALFTDMHRDGVETGRIAVINISAQQHGHLYLNGNFTTALQRLSDGFAQQGLPELLSDCYSYGTVPIWMTSDTGPEAAHIRSVVGGKERMIELSGSDSPLRFSGAVVKRVGRCYPEIYENTERILLLNTFLAAVLSARDDVPSDYGNNCHQELFIPALVPVVHQAHSAAVAVVARDDVPSDYGNSCGMSLMNYRNKRWDKKLLMAVADDLPGGSVALTARLPSLTEPFEAVGTIAPYFRDRYGLPPQCLIAAGSGDNPQTKVLVPGDLLSLGTSFVNMVTTDGETLDLNGYANAMYDGLGRPFMFGCRTNGALVWDRIRSYYGLAREEYEPAERSLAQSSAADTLVLWQPNRESFPDSPQIPLSRPEGGEESLASDYSGLIDSSLGLLYHYSRAFSESSSTEERRGSSFGRTEPLYLTGGPTESEEILRRIAAIWNREVVTIGKVGAALGAAAAGLETLGRAGYLIDSEDLIRRILPTKRRAHPDPSYLQAYHGEGAYLRRLVQAFERRNGE